MGASMLAEIRWQLLDGDGLPYAGALLYSYAAGTDTAQATYSDSDLTTPNANPLVADADGRFGPIFLLPTGYKFVAKDADEVTVWTQDNYSDPGAIFAENYGTVMAEGARSVTSGYTATDEDQTVTVASSGATVFNFPSAATRTKDLTVKNMGGGTVVCTPAGSDVVDGALATYTIAAASSPTFPAVTFRPVTGGWLIVGSHP